MRGRLANEGTGLVIWVTPDPEVADRYEIRLSESTGLLPGRISFVATIENVDDVCEQVRKWLGGVLQQSTKEPRGDR